jgi:hypothetical protein
VIDTYDAKSGKVSFYDDNGDYDDPAIRFNSNLRNWLETYEVILYNARELYMRLVGQYLHCPEAAADPVAGGSADSSSEVSSPTPVQHLAAIQSSTPMNALLRWPRATPEDLLGRLQWYMDRFVSPDVHKVMVAVIDGNISCWRGWGGFVSDLQLQPSHLAKHATTGIYTITQRSAPAVRYITKSKSIAKVVVEHHHNFKGIDADGWCQYWCDEMIDGELNTSSFDQEKRARHYNIYQLLSSPGTIVKLVNRRDY